MRFDAAFFFFFSYLHSLTIPGGKISLSLYFSNNLGPGSGLPHSPERPLAHLIRQGFHGANPTRRFTKNSKKKILQILEIPAPFELSFCGVSGSTEDVDRPTKLWLAVRNLRDAVPTGIDSLHRETHGETGHGEKKVRCTTSTVWPRLR